MRLELARCCEKEVSEGGNLTTPGRRSPRGRKRIEVNVPAEAALELLDLAYSPTTIERDHERERGAGPPAPPALLLQGGCCIGRPVSR